MLKRFLFSCVAMLVFVGCSLDPLPVFLTMSATPENITIRQGESKTINIAIDVELIDYNLILRYNKDHRYHVDTINYNQENLEKSMLLTLTSDDPFDCNMPYDFSTTIDCNYRGNKRSNFIINLTLTIEAKEDLNVGNYGISLETWAYSRDLNPIRLIYFESESGGTGDSHSINIEVVAL